MHEDHPGPEIQGLGNWGLPLYSLEAHGRLRTKSHPQPTLFLLTDREAPSVREAPTISEVFPELSLRAHQKGQ